MQLLLGDSKIDASGTWARSLYPAEQTWSATGIIADPVRAKVGFCISWVRHRAGHALAAVGVIREQKSRRK
jgi:hypothetical protein